MARRLGAQIIIAERHKVQAWAYVHINYDIDCVPRGPAYIGVLNISDRKMGGLNYSSPRMQIGVAGAVAELVAAGKELTSDAIHSHMTTADCVLAGVPIFNPAIPDPGGEWSLADDFEEHGEAVATLLSGELAQDWEAATRDLIVHDCEFDALISTKTWRS